MQIEIKSKWEYLYLDKIDVKNQRKTKKSCYNNNKGLNSARRYKKYQIYVNPTPEYPDL